MTDEVRDGRRHGVDMAGRAGDGLRQHPPLAIEDAGRQVARLAHDGGKCRAQQCLRLLLDHGDEPVPHDLQLDVTDRLGHGFLPQLAAGLAVSTSALPASTQTSKLDEAKVEVPSSTMRTGPLIEDPGGRSLLSNTGTQMRLPSAASNTLRSPIAAPARRRGAAGSPAGGSVGVVASTTQLMISISALGMKRANSR